MENPTKYEPKLIEGKIGIKNHQNMSREKLLRALYELKHILKNLSQNRLERIAKIHNLSQNYLEQITKMNNLSRNDLEQIANERGIKKIQEYVKRRIINLSFKIRAKHC